MEWVNLIIKVQIAKKIIIPAKYGVTFRILHNESPLQSNLVEYLTLSFSQINVPVKSKLHCTPEASLTLT